MKRLLILFFFAFHFFLSAQEEPIKEPLVKVRTLEDILKETAQEASRPSAEKKKEKETQKQPEKTEETCEVFNGILSVYDLFLEKEGSRYSLWIRRKGSIGSVALVTYKTHFKGNWRYFLRSPSELENQKDNRIRYKDSLIGPEKGLFFLASSEVQIHPVLGEAFRIIIPKKMVFGYKTPKSNEGKLLLLPGKTIFLIRTFDEEHGQGSFRDNPYFFPHFDAEKTERPRIREISRKKKDGFSVLEMEYLSPQKSLNKILLKEGEKKEVFYPVSTKQEVKKEDLAFLPVFWGYHSEAGVLKVKFYLIAADRPRKMELIFQSGGEAVYPIELK